VSIWALSDTSSAPFRFRGMGVIILWQRGGEFLLCYVVGAQKKKDGVGAMQ